MSRWSLCRGAAGKVFLIALILGAGWPSVRGHTAQPAEVERVDLIAEAGAWPLGVVDTVQSSFAFVPPSRIYVTRMAADDLTVCALGEPVRRAAGRLR